MSTEQPEFAPRGPHAYSSGPGGPPPPPAGSGPSVRPSKQRNVIAIVALIAAVLGFIFAVLEGAYLIGWILLPIAFVLSLVALFQRDKPKKLAVAALIITIIGTLAGVIAFVTTIGKAIDDAFTETTTEPVEQQPADEPPAEEEPAGGDPAEEPAEEPGGDQGTRANPYPLGTTLANDDWEVTVNSFTPDATAEVMAENQFNDEPEAGHTYALANLTVTYLGEDSGTPFEITVAYVTAGGNVVHTYDHSALGPDELPDNELYTGASATGNVVLHVPEGDAGLLRINAGLLADEVFVAIQ